MASDKPSEDKKDPIKQDSEESPLGSSPDGGDSTELGDTGLLNPTPEQAPKRKGGRKPVRCLVLPLLLSFFFLFPSFRLTLTIFFTLSLITTNHLFIILFLDHLLGLEL